MISLVYINVPIMCIGLSTPPPPLSCKHPPPFYLQTVQVPLPLFIQPPLCIGFS